MQRITAGQRRARLARRHHLSRRCRTDDVVAIAEGLVGFHATDPATVFLSAMARMRRPSPAPLEAALYEERVLVRTLGMRRTMFVLPSEVVPVVQAACTDALVAGERARTEKLLAEVGVADPARHLRALEEATLAAIEERGELTGAELSRSVPGLDLQIPVGQGKRWEGTIGISTRVLFLLATEQRVVRGRPKGSWTSSQYRWSPMSAWVPSRHPKPSAEAARTELVRRWLRGFGPGTITDLKWWTGLTLGQVRAALAGLDVVEVDLDGETGVVLADDLPSPARISPGLVLLPSLDATVMGWKQRHWYLGDHERLLFDGNGNAGPTVWMDGRVIGGWAQRRSGEVVHRLLEDVGREIHEAVALEAAMLEKRLGTVRVTPRFPTPLQRELVA